MSGNVSRRLAAACRMAEVDGVAQVQVLDDRRGICGVVVHVVAVADLARTPVPAPVVSDHSKTLSEEKKHLRVPVVAAERPAVMKHQRLRVFRTPVFEVNLRAIFARDRVHGLSPTVQAFVMDTWEPPTGSILPGGTQRRRCRRPHLRVTFLRNRAHGLSPGKLAQTFLSVGGTDISVGANYGTHRNVCATKKRLSFLRR